MRCKYVKKEPWIKEWIKVKEGHKTINGLYQEDTINGGYKWR